MNLISLFISSILAENVVLTKFLGICPLFGTVRREKETISMGLTITLMTVLSSLITYIIYNNILVTNDLEYLTIIIFVIIILIMTKLFTLIIKSFFTGLNDLFGAYLPLIAINSAVFGIVLISIKSDYTLLEVLIYSLGGSIGYMLVSYILSSIMKRLDHAPIIKSFKGLPIIFITLFIMALIFARYVVA